MYKQTNKQTFSLLSTFSHQAIPMFPQTLHNASHLSHVSTNVGGHARAEFLLAGMRRTYEPLTKGLVSGGKIPLKRTFSFQMVGDIFSRASSSFGGQICLELSANQIARNSKRDNLAEPQCSYYFCKIFVFEAQFVLIFSYYKNIKATTTKTSFER